MMMQRNSKRIRVSMATALFSVHYIIYNILSESVHFVSVVRFEKVKTISVLIPSQFVTFTDPLRFVMWFYDYVKPLLPSFLRVVFLFNADTRIHIIEIPMKNSMLKPIYCSTHLFTATPIIQKIFLKFDQFSIFPNF